MVASSIVEGISGEWEVEADEASRKSKTKYLKVIEHDLEDEQVQQSK